MSIEHEIEAIRHGRGVVRLSGRTVTRIRGADARDWLSDLLTAEVRDLERGQARASMLLTPTGRVRAVLTVACIDDDLMLVQDDRQPDPIAKLLSPYVLSSDVDLIEEALLCAVLPAAPPDPTDGLATVTPSTLGVGKDVFAADPRVLERATEGLVAVSETALERWRIEEGLARFPADISTDSLPHEVDAGEAIEDSRGCYLGQEAVARVRNLGHPPRVVVRVRGESELAPGSALLSGGSEVGTVTSAVATTGIARVRWAARDSALEDETGASVVVAGRAGLFR